MSLPILHPGEGQCIMTGHTAVETPGPTPKGEAHSPEFKFPLAAGMSDPASQGHRGLPPREASHLVFWSVQLGRGRALKGLNKGINSQLWISVSRTAVC